MVGGLEHEGVEVGFGELDDVIGLLALLLLLLRLAACLLAAAATACLTRLAVLHYIHTYIHSYT
jgi:hypothetical protein